MRNSTDRRVFLNIPYAKRFQDLYLAYLVGLVNLGLEPVVTLQDAQGQTRVDRIYELIRSCRYSVHDLSWVRLDGRSPRLPRFNMPFELGLAVAYSNHAESEHSWIVFDAVRYQAQRTLSDLAGTDFNIHENSPRGVLKGLCSAFVLEGLPKVPKMLHDLEILRTALPELKRTCGTNDLFDARIFHEILIAIRGLSGKAKAR